MKKIITLLAVFISASAFAQQPAQVKVSKTSKNKLEKMYPNAREVSWTKDDQGRYVAHFTEYSKNRWITIDEKNGWSNSLLEVEKADLPAAAITQLDQYYSDTKFIHFYKFIDETGRVFYEADRALGGYESGPIFDSDGIAVSKAARPLGERPTRIQ